MPEDFEFTPFPDRQRLEEATARNNFNRSFPKRGGQLGARREYDAVNYAEVVLQQQKAVQSQEIRTSKLAQDFYFRSQALNMNREAQEAKLKHDAGLFEATMESTKALTRARMAREQADIEAAQVDAKNAEDEASDTKGFAAHIKKAKLGSFQYQVAVAEALRDFPGVEDAYAKRMWATAKPGELTPGQVLERAAEARAALPVGSTATVSQRGGMTVTARPEKEVPAEGEAVIRSKIEELEEKQAKADGDATPNSKLSALYARRIAAERAKLPREPQGFSPAVGDAKVADAQAAAAAATAPVGASDADTQALAWATANPADPRAAKIRARLGK